MIGLLWLLNLAAAATPDEAVRAALAQDPAIAMAEARVERARGALAGTGFFLENPSIDAGFAVVGSRLELGLSQSLSLGGEGIQARGAARAEGDAARWALVRTRLEVAASARLAWIQVVEAEGVLAFHAADLDSAGRLRELAELRLSAGDGTVLELRLARLEEAAAVGAWLEADRSLREVRALFAAQTGLDMAEPVEGDPLAAAPWTEVAPGDSRADVAAAEASEDAARHAVAAAKAGRVPELSVGAFVEQDPDGLLVGPTVGLELPLWRHNETEVGEARAAQIEAEASTRALRARAGSEQKAAAAQQASILRAAQILGDVPPEELTTTLAELELAYRSGELSMADVLVLRGRFRAGQLAWFDARATIARARIDAALAVEAETLLLPAGP